MQKTVLVALAIIGTLTAGYLLFGRNPTKPDAPTDLKNIYSQWKLSYNINVGAAEDSFRFQIFSNNYAKIVATNKLGKSYTLGLNAFTALTQEEFAATRLGLKMPKTEAKNFTVLPLNGTANVDWRGKMNAVKNQGQCGSCWAFSAVGALEGVHSVLKGNLLNLAEQELVDCSTSFGNEGCNGGLMDQAFQYVQSVGGLANEKDYPYKGADGRCKTGLKRAGAITGFKDVEVNNPDALKAAIAQQPVAVAIEADTFVFQSYTTGVINDDSCGTQLDHGVVAVGYNDQEATPFFLVRNSWGSGWGDQGHVRIGIQAGAGVCGIQQAASYPTA